MKVKDRILELINTVENDELFPLSNKDIEEINNIRNLINAPRSTAKEIVKELRKEIPIYKDLSIKYDKKAKSFYYHTNDKLLVNIARITRQGKLSISFEISPELIKKTASFFMQEGKDIED